MSEEMIKEEINADSTTETETPAQVEEEPRSIVLEEAIEAILFAAGHPISYATLARVLESTPSKIRDAVNDYALKYNNSDIPRGVLLLTYSDNCQLCTKQHYITEIRDALGIKKSGTLSSAALETLAIVAYNQPVTRLFVDTLRKVDSSYAMNSLIDRGLIECQGRLDVPGRPMLYGTTSDFLRCFGLESLESLPKTTEEIAEVFAKTKVDTELIKLDEVSNAEQLEILNREGDEVASLEADNEYSATEATESVSEATVEEETEEPSAEDDIGANDF